MHPDTSLRLLLRRLTRRKLAQWGLSYLAVAWLLAQVFDLVGDQFGWPAALLRGLIVALGFGFLLVLIIAWYHGEKGQQHVSMTEVLLLASVSLAGAVAVMLATRAPLPELTGPGAAGSVLPATVERASVAVLPFVDMSPRRDQEYFSDGMTEELLHALGQVEGLRVAARTSAFSFKGATPDLREAGRRLRVASLVEGSIRKVGDSVRITAQLIDAETGYQLWSQRYDRELADVLAVQEEIARAIAGALQLELGASPNRGLVRSHTADPMAHDLYLRGRFHWNKRTPESLRQALASFQQAIARDSTYALAWAGLADTYMTFFDYGLMPPQEATQEGRAAATRALALDPTLAEAHNSLAHAHLHDWRWGEAEREFRRAIELDPSYASAYHWYALALTAVGRTQDAVTVMQQAQRLDPLSLRINTDLGMALYAAGHYDEAIEQERRTLELEPDFPVPLWITGMAYEQKGMLDEAKRYYRLALEKAPGNDNFLAALAHAEARDANTGEARRILRELESRAAGGAASPFFIALVYSGLGEADTALHWLERSIEERAGSARYLKVERRLDPLRAHPRYQQLLRRVRLD